MKGFKITQVFLFITMLCFAQLDAMHLNNNNSDNNTNASHREQEDRCAICFCNLDKNTGNNVVALICDFTTKNNRHRFHEDCLDPWLKIQKTCPTCRSKIKEEPVHEDPAHEEPLHEEPLYKKWLHTIKAFPLNLWNTFSHNLNEKKTYILISLAVAITIYYLSVNDYSDDTIQIEVYSNDFKESYRKDIEAREYIKANIETIIEVFKESLLIKCGSNAIHQAANQFFAQTKIPLLQIFDLDYINNLRSELEEQSPYWLEAFEHFSSLLIEQVQSNICHPTIDKYFFSPDHRVIDDRTIMQILKTALERILCMVPQNGMIFP